MPETIASAGYVSKPVGMRNLTYWTIKEYGDDGKPTYGEAVPFARVISGTRTPNLLEAVLDSDDAREDDISLPNTITVGINVSQLTLARRAELLGHKQDANGGMLVGGHDSTADIAIAWREELTNEIAGTDPKYQYVVLYKGKFKEFAENSATKSPEGFTIQTQNIEGTFSKLEDAQESLMYILRDDEAKEDAEEAIAAWFTTPQFPPDETIEPTP